MDKHEGEPDGNPPPSQPPLLNYRPADAGGVWVATGWQVALGFATWVAILVLVIYLSVAASVWMSHVTGYTFLALAFIAVVGICAYVRLKWKWRGFIPGVLLGFGITCLLPLGILVIVCGQW